MFAQHLTHSVTVIMHADRAATNSPLRVLKNTEWVSLIDQLSTKTSVLLLAKTAPMQNTRIMDNRNMSTRLYTV